MHIDIEKEFEKFRILTFYIVSCFCETPIDFNENSMAGLTAGEEKNKQKSITPVSFVISR